MLAKENNVVLLLLLATLAVVPINAFLTQLAPSRLLVNSRTHITSSSNQIVVGLREASFKSSSRRSVLFMEGEGDQDETLDDESPDADDNVDESGETSATSVDDDASAVKTIKTYKSGLSPRRNYQYEPRPGSTSPKRIDVTMKFGGSSLANAERVDHVANLIKDRINPPATLEDGSPNEETPVRPRAVICSAMGKTTNSLLSAGEMALEGRVDVEALRTLHTTAMKEFDLPQRTQDEVMCLLDECEDMLNGVRLIQELSPKSLDQLVSYGERCSVRIMAARLNQIGVPAQAFDAWDVGVFTDENYGDAKLLPTTIDTIREKFMSRIDPNVVAVVTGFIGEFIVSTQSKVFAGVMYLHRERFNGGMKLPMIYERTTDCKEIMTQQCVHLIIVLCKSTTRAEDHVVTRQYHQPIYEAYSLIVTSKFHLMLIIHHF